MQANWEVEVWTSPKVSRSSRWISKIEQKVKQLKPQCGSRNSLMSKEGLRNFDLVMLWCKNIVDLRMMRFVWESTTMIWTLQAANILICIEASVFAEQATTCRKVLFHDSPCFKWIKLPKQAHTQWWVLHNHICSLVREGWVSSRWLPFVENSPHVAMEEPSPSFQIPWCCHHLNWSWTEGARGPATCLTPREPKGYYHHQLQFQTKWCDFLLLHSHSDDY